MPLVISKAVLFVKKKTASSTQPRDFAQEKAEIQNLSKKVLELILKNPEKTGVILSDWINGKSSQKIQTKKKCLTETISKNELINLSSF